MHGGFSNVKDTVHEDGEITRQAVKVSLSLLAVLYVSQLYAQEVRLDIQVRIDKLGEQVRYISIQSLSYQHDQ